MAQNMIIVIIKTQNTIIKVINGSRKVVGLNVKSGCRGNCPSGAAGMKTSAGGGVKGLEGSIKMC